MAISEAAIVTGIDCGLEARYANLLIPFFVTQADKDESGGADVNVVVNAEGALLVPCGARLWVDVYAQDSSSMRTNARRSGTRWRTSSAPSRSGTPSVYLP